jgi:hypothetical protein
VVPEWRKPDKKFCPFVQPGRGVSCECRKGSCAVWDDDRCSLVSISKALWKLSVSIEKEG